MRLFSLNSAFKALILGCILLQSAMGWAFSLQNSYIPPEIAYAEDLKQRVSMPEKLELNTMNLGELKNLPGLSEDWALKILRNRPFADVQDFYKRMPGVSSKQLQLLIQQWQPHLKF